MSQLDQLGTTSSKTRDATKVVLDALAANGKSVKQIFGAGPSGEHATGYATDFMVYSNKALGDWIADWIWNHREELGVWYIMWQHRIKSVTVGGKYGPAGVWNWVEDRGNSTQNHMDHVHVSWNKNAVKPVQLSKPVAPAPAPIKKPAPAPAPAPVPIKDDEMRIIRCDGRTWLAVFNDGTYKPIPKGVPQDSYAAAGIPVHKVSEAQYNGLLTFLTEKK